VLWRKFCADNGVPVETLPSDLSGGVKEQWEKLKAERLGDKP
jgi:predicted amidohydrolase